MKGRADARITCKNAEQLQRQSGSVGYGDADVLALLEEFEKQIKTLTARLEEQETNTNAIMEFLKSQNAETVNNEDQSMVVDPNGEENSQVY
jgi:cystathionine beta-lyase/cystathionine gamma-synthase